jgi:hypothetical protein
MLSRRQKIIIVAVFVILVVMYTGAAATGGGSGQGDASGRPGGIVGWLGDTLGQPPAVARADLSAPCLDQQTLTVKGSCALTVAKSTKDTRRLKLHAEAAVTVASRAPQGSDTVTADVEAGKDVSVTVDGKGGVVVITCPGDSCVVTLPEK